MRVIKEMLATAEYYFRCVFLAGRRVEVQAVGEERLTHAQLQDFKDGIVGWERSFPQTTGECKGRN